MGWENSFRLAGIAIIILITFFSLFKDNRSRIAWLAFIGAFDYFAIKLGVVWEPGKIVGFTLLLLVITHWGNYSRALKSSNLRLMMVYFIYVGFMTLIQVPFLPQSRYLPGDFLYNEGRFLVQYFKIFMGLAVALVTWKAIMEQGNVRFIVRSLVAGGTVLAIYGLYQWYANKVGLPATGITRGGGSQQSSEIVVFLIDRQYVGRAYGFAGEPKGLAAILSLSIMLLVSLPHSYVFGQLGKWIGVLVLIVMFVVFLLTFSTAGYIMLVLGFTFVFILLIRFRYSRKTMQAVLVAPILFVLAGSIFQATVNLSLETVAEQRVTDRIGGGSGLSYADKAIIKTWQDRPVIFILGAGLGGSSFYVRQYSDRYAGFTAAPRGILGRIGDSGLIGFILWASAIWIMFLRCMKYRYVSSRTDSLAVLVLCSYCTMMAFTISSWFIEWLLYGVLAGIASVSSVKSMKRKISGVGIQVPSQ